MKPEIYKKKNRKERETLWMKSEIYKTKNIKEKEKQNQEPDVRIR